MVEPAMHTRPSALAAVVLGVGAVVPWCLLEALSWQNRNPLGILAALLVGASVGGLIGLSTCGLRDRRVLAAVLILPWLVAGAADVTWALDRALTLKPSLVIHSVEVGAVLIGLLVGWAGWLGLRATGLRRPFRIAISLSLGVVGINLSLMALNEVALPFAMVVGWLFIAAMPALVVLGYRQTTVAGLLAVGAGLALTVLPDRYAELQRVLGGVTLGASFVVSRGLWRERQPTAPGRAQRWTLIMVVLLGLLALGYAAHHLVVADDRAWKAKQGAGGELSFLVRLGQDLTDLDGDGDGFLFGRDCGPLDPNVAPGAHERLANGIDDNCNAGDATGDVVSWFRAREAWNPLPPPFQGDIVLVIVDALRFDDASSSALTNIAAWRAGGVELTRAYATSSFTSLSLMGVLSGRLPTNIPLRWTNRMHGLPTRAPGGLAMSLSARGYATAFVGGNGTGEQSYFSDDAFGHGFQVLAHTAYEATAASVTDTAIEVWRSAEGQRPRFLYVHYLSVHNANHDREEYRAAVGEMDDALGRLRAAIGPHALWILTADHGEEFNEHGHIGHASTLWEEVMHVPLVVAAPGLEPARIGRVTSLRSLAPTVLAMVAPEQAPPGLGPYFCLDAASANDQCTDQEAPMALEMRDVHLHGLIVGDQQIVRDLTQGYLRAFDLVADPAGQHPLEPIPVDLLHAFEAWEEMGLAATGDAHLWPYSQR